MAKKPDLYTVGQASIALGVSIKRVRQMIKEGKLTEYSRNPVTIKQLEVLALRSQRLAEGKSVEAPHIKQAVGNSRSNEANYLLEQIREIVSGSNEANRRAIEMTNDIAKRNEENLLSQINELKAELATLKAVQVPAKKWFRR
jgi:hypothetical protein